MTRNRNEIVEAVLRLSCEALIRVDEVSWEMCVSKETVKRWGINGRRGVHLDIVKRDGVWCTSQEALVRFSKSLAIKDNERRQLAGRTT